MPEEIINKFKDQYGKDGENIFYATAKAQGRDPHTFKKESSMESNQQAEDLDKVLDEAMEGLDGAIAPAIVSSPANMLSNNSASNCPVGGGAIIQQEPAPMITLSPSPIVGNPSGGLPETVPGEVVPPAGAILAGAEAALGAEAPLEDEQSLMEKKDKKKEDFLKQIKGAGAGKDRKGNAHMPKAKQVFKTKKDKEDKPKHKQDWKKFDESVNLYIARTSRNSDIGVNSLEKLWNECVEAQTQGEYAKNTRKFWIEVKSKFDRKVNEIFLQEAKKKMTERQKMNAEIETFLEHVAKDRYVEAKSTIKEMAQACVNSMISDRKVQYQKALAENIAQKVREAK